VKPPIAGIEYSGEEERGNSKEEEVNTIKIEMFPEGLPERIPEGLSWNGLYALRLLQNWHSKRARSKLLGDGAKGKLSSVLRDSNHNKFS
jgi:hypothetical protein